MKISFKIQLIISLFFYILFSFQGAFSATVKTGEKPALSVNQILDNLEKRFEGSGFSADFYQESPIQDIGITESAAGEAYFKKPKKFRWEYTTPDTLHYISDGKKLWIHSPEDNNVWVGETAYFFGKESSASFLTDISLIRKKFNVTMSDKKSKTDWVLALTPSTEAAFGLKKIFLSISKQTGNISKIVSFNLNNSETRIILSNYNFTKIPPDELFEFKMPKNANIIPLK